MKIMNNTINTITRIAVVALLAATIGTAPTQVLAGDAKRESAAAAEKKEAPGGEKKQGRVPFHGKIASVDKKAKTFTVGERTFQVTSETKLNKGGKPATLDDAAVGEDVGGNYEKAHDGKLNAKMVRIGPKVENEVKAQVKKTGAKDQ